MTATPEHYATILNRSPIDAESVTYLVVAGATRAEVAEALGLDLTRQVKPEVVNDDTNYSAYALAEVPGGVIAMESTGYADPPTNVLRALSQHGRSAAVTRSNIQAHVRFGCARDGVLLFDDDEYTFIDNDDLDSVPAEIRTLFDLAWEDLDDDTDVKDVDPVAVGLAMSQVITGVAVTVESLLDAHAAGYYLAPSQQYSVDGDWIRRTSTPVDVRSEEYGFRSGPAQPGDPRNGEKAVGSVRCTGRP